MQRIRQYTDTVIDSPRQNELLLAQEIMEKCNVGKA